eukprot:s17_g21.t1
MCCMDLSLMGADFDVTGSLSSTSQSADHRSPSAGCAPTILTRHAVKVQIWMPARDGGLRPEKLVVAAMAAWGSVCDLRGAMSGSTIEEFALPQGPPKVFWPQLPDGYVPPDPEEMRRKEDERRRKEIRRQEAERREVERRRKEEILLSAEDCEAMLEAQEVLANALREVQAKKARAAGPAVEGSKSSPCASKDEQDAPTLLQTVPAEKKTNPAGPLTSEPSEPLKPEKLPAAQSWFDWLFACPCFARDKTATFTRL